MSDYLFATPSFAEGIARNIDLFGSMNVYNTSKSPEAADERAYLEDVKALRKDMDVAISGVLKNE